MLSTVKSDLSEWLDISKDALHVHVGLALYLSLVLMLRRRPGSVVPWLIVLFLEAGNELIDAIHHGGFQLDPGDALRDLANTMLWPTVLLFAARFYCHMARTHERK